jgi:CRP/FNR family transcriptional regulator, cyclic AMP receptor protein
MIEYGSLRKHSLFGGVTDADMQVIIPMLLREEFSPGDFIIHEHDSGNRIYFITEGQVEVLKDVPGSPGKQQQIALLQEGDSFGEMELIDIQKRAASIRTLSNTVTLSLSNSDMFSIYQTNVQAFAMIVMNMAREISRRLRDMDAIVASSLFNGNRAISLED